MMLSIRAYARRIGISHTAVTKQVKDGIIPLHNGKIDAEEADRCRRTRCDPSRLKSVSPPAPDDHLQDDDGPAAGTLAAERLRGEQLKNRQREIAIAEADGRLVDKEQTKRAVFALARELRESWQNWPARVAPTMAAELGVDQRKLQGVLDKAVREHLTEFADRPLKI